MNATMGRHARRHRSMRDVRRTAIDGTEIARGLQKECRRWLVIWSAWRQTYTAFACCTRESLIIDEAKIDRFLERIKEAETAMIASRSAAV